MRKKLPGYWDYTVILTYSGMLFAFCGIMRVIGQDYWEAVFCLMLAGICDMFDGTVAAIKDRNEREKRFGIQIDSLSDLIGFGVLPGLFAYMISDRNAFTGLIAALYVLCALIRLAYFNVLEEERQRRTEEKRESYMGVPVTTVAILLPMLYLLYDLASLKKPVCFSVLLILLGAGFLSPIEIKKPKIFMKACIIVLGVLEAAGMVIFMGWDLL